MQPGASAAVLAVQLVGGSAQQQAGHRSVTAHTRQVQRDVRLQRSQGAEVRATEVGGQRLRLQRLQGSEVTVTEVGCQRFRRQILEVSWLVGQRGVRLRRLEDKGHPCRGRRDQRSHLQR